MAANRFVKIVRENIISCLTGGFYTDSSQPHTVNVIHLYTWIAFFISPLIVYFMTSNVWTGITIYCSISTGIVGCIKLAIWKLHNFLDITEPIIVQNASSTGDPNFLPGRKEHIEQECIRIGMAGLQRAEIDYSLSNMGNLKSFMQPQEDNHEKVVDISSGATPVPESGIVRRSSDEEEDVLFKRRIDGFEIDISRPNNKIPIYSDPDEYAVCSSFGQAFKKLDHVLKSTNSACECHVDEAWLPTVVSASSLQCTPSSSDARYRLSTANENQQWNKKHPFVRANVEDYELLHPRSSVKSPSLCVGRASSIASVSVATSNQLSNLLELAQYKRHLRQLKLDVNQLQLPPSTDFTPEALPTTQSRSRVRPIRRTRSSSQSLQNAAMSLNSRNQNSITIATTTTAAPSSFGLHHYRQQLATAGIPAVNFSELRYSDAILLWRREFAAAFRGQTRASQSVLALQQASAMRSQSLRQPDRSHQGGATGISRTNSNQWRNAYRGNSRALSSTNALVRTPSLMHRPGLRRLGSNLHLRRQQSTGSSLPLSQLPPTRASLAAASASAPKHSRTSTGGAVTGTNNSVFTEQSGTTKQLGSAPSARDNQVVFQLGNQPSTSTVSRERSERCANNSTETGTSEQVTSAGADAGPPSSAGEALAQNVDSSAATPSTSQIPGPSTSTARNVVSPDSSSAVRQNIETILSQMVGVRSLSEAGLSVQTCLEELLAACDNSDTERPDLDILLALATTFNEHSDAQPVAPASPASDAVGVMTPAVPGDRSVSSGLVARGSRPSPSPRPGRSSGTFSHCPDTSEDELVRTPPPVCQVTFGSQVRPDLCSQQLYHWQPFSSFPLVCRLRLDRLLLDALFDRSSSCLELLLSVSVALLVSVLGSLVLRSSELERFGLIACCFALAGCHYCLVKSVQPDPASPQHGFNRIILFSRTLLFSILAAIFLLSMDGAPAGGNLPTAGVGDIRVGSRLVAITWGELNQLTRSHVFAKETVLLPRHVTPLSSNSTSSSSVLSNPLPVAPTVGGWPRTKLDSPSLGNSSSQEGVTSESPVANRSGAPQEQVELSPAVGGQLTLFGYNVSLARLASTAHLTVNRLLLVFPLFFLLGLVPQVNTLVIYLCEQADINILGGSGAAGLFSGLFSLSRSLVSLFLCYWLASYAFSHGDPNSNLVSIFWGLQLTVCYLLSRLPSNITLYSTSLLLLLRSSSSHDDKLSWRKELARCSTWLSDQCLCFRQRVRRSWSKRTQGVSRRTRDSSIAWWRRCYQSLLSKKSLVAVPGAHKPGPSETSNPLLSSGQRSVSLCRAEVIPVDGEEQIPRSPATLPRTFSSEPTIVSLRRGYNFAVSLPSESQRPFESLVDVHACRPSSSQRLSADNQWAGSTDAAAAAGVATAGQRHELADNSNAVLLHQCRQTGKSLSLYSDCQSTLVDGERSGDSLAVSYTAGDPLQTQVHRALVARLVNDCLLSLLWFPLGVGLHRLACALAGNDIAQAVFLRYTVIGLAVFGFFLHYVWPNLRKTYPWLCFTKVPIPPHQKGNIVAWEIAYVWLCRFESTCLLPFITIVCVTQAITSLNYKFGLFWSTLILMVTSMKMLRNSFSATRLACLSIFFTEIMFNFDYARFSETFPVNYFFVSIFLVKASELFRKLHFVYMYTYPFRITWGSLAHAVIHIAFVPHTVFMLTNCLVSTLLSSPLEPFLASAVFITSYVRPIKFWEVSHRAERMETTNTSLATQLHGISSEHVATNLNALFYERLARNIQQTLAGDIYLGRLGGLTVEHGDFFIMGSDDFNFILHIIEVANGLVTFQLRGLEFLGTYCHARETDALRCTSHNDDNLCCWSPGHIPGMLSFNAALRMRSMTWQFIYSTYCVEGYQISSYGVDAMIHLPDFRKLLVGNFIRCIVYYVMRLPNLAQRLESLVPCLTANNFFSHAFVDLDPAFQRLVDEDFDDNVDGVSRRRFCQAYLDWIQYCHSKHPGLAEIPCDRDSPLVTLCFALTLLGRRCVIGTQAANYNMQEVFRGIHDVFKGDVHVHSKDEWVLADIYLLQSVITLSMRVVLKLCQDSFLSSSEKTMFELYRTIVETERQFVIYHETDPRWRYAVLNNAPRLFSIRRVGTESSTYSITHLNKSQLHFSAVKINPECVRGLWAGQQREQIYLRNTNPERGSIQGAQHVLRNLVNSSCDPPIGYPIYVSPLLTSFVGTNQQYCRVAGPELSLLCILTTLRGCLRRLFGGGRMKQQERMGAGARRSTSPELSQYIELTAVDVTAERRRRRSAQRRSILPDTSAPGSPTHGHRAGTLSRSESEVKMPGLSTSILVHEHSDSSRPGSSLVKVVDLSQIIYDRFNSLSWPPNDWRHRCVTEPYQLAGLHSHLEGEVIHRWTPNNLQTTARSFCHRVIALVAFPHGPRPLQDRLVLVWEDTGLLTLPVPSRTSAAGSLGSEVEDDELGCEYTIADLDC